MTRMAAADGTTYAVHDIGMGSVTMLLHGFAGSGRTWDGVADRLGVGRRLVTVDLLGHGGSDAPPAARHDVQRQAADIASIIERLADGRSVDVIGYSFGARIALWLAVTTPARVRRLVLESPSAGITEAQARVDRVAADERWAQLLDTGDLVAFHEAWEAQPVFVSRARLPDGARAAIRAEHLGADARGLAASLRGAGQGAMPPLGPRLHLVETPTLVLAGTLDPVGQARATGVAQGIPGARLVLLEDMGHAPHLECPERFVRITNDFLGSSTQGAS